MQDGSTVRIGIKAKSVKQLRNYCRNHRKDNSQGFFIADEAGNVKTYKFPTDEHSHR
jgi:hypothetical protein